MDTLRVISVAAIQKKKVTKLVFLQCFDTVGWMTGRSFGP